MKWTILIFPGGTENGLEIQKSLKYCKEIKLLSATNSQINHAEYVYHHNIQVPDVRENGWLEKLNDIVHQHKIDFIYPANAYVIDALSPVRKQLNCQIILDSEDIIELTRSKKRTLELLQDIIPVPKIYKNENDVQDLPIFLKPNNGYGSQGATIIDSVEVLKNAISSGTDILIQEYLPGREYTIDCFSNQGALLFCSGRHRERVRMGTSMHSHVAADYLQKIFTEYAQMILKKVPLAGAWFFQMKEDTQGNLKLLEVEARIAGTMALNRARGINFALLHFYLVTGIPFEIKSNTYSLKIDRSLLNRYQHNITYSTVYIDLDDTIIVNNQINLEIIKFLYQCLNNGIKLVLVSKSLAENKMAFLKRWRIETLFDEIHWLNETDDKSHYIKDINSIFIDDSFSQRQQVSQRHGIPTFDCSMIEMLIDDRV